MARRLRGGVGEERAGDGQRSPDGTGSHQISAGQGSRRPIFVLHRDPPVFKSAAICRGSRYPSSAVARNRGTFLAFVACSKAYAILISFGSLQAGPMKERPIGMPRA